MPLQLPLRVVHPMPLQLPLRVVHPMLLQLPLGVVHPMPLQLIRSGVSNASTTHLEWCIQ